MGNLQDLPTLYLHMATPYLQCMFSSIKRLYKNDFGQAPAIVRRRQCGKQEGGHKDMLNIIAGQHHRVTFWPQHCTAQFQYSVPTVLVLSTGTLIIAYCMHNINLSFNCVCKSRITSCSRNKKVQLRTLRGNFQTVELASHSS